jgi:hypothetical protein
MTTRDALYPVGILAAGIVLGAVAVSFGRNPAWPIVIGLAAVVLATLAVHVRSIAAAEGQGAPIGRSTLVAASLVIGGIALLLGTCAPDTHMGKGNAFTVWVGWSALLMGIALAYAIRLIDHPRLNAKITLVRGRNEVRGN